MQDHVTGSCQRRITSNYNIPIFVLVERSVVFLPPLNFFFKMNKLSMQQNINSNEIRDNYIDERIPAQESQAEYLFDLPELHFPEKLNCANELINRQLNNGFATKCAIQGEHYAWTYQQLEEKTNQIANVLTKKFGLIPGNRVLLRSPNNPMLAACWLAVIKAGCIAVTTMPLLRARDLKPVIEKANIDFALCEQRLSEELEILQKDGLLKTIVYFDAIEKNAELNELLIQQDIDFAPVDSNADDVALIAFTSGTTGKPKGCIHYHRDVLSMAICYSKQVLKPSQNDIFIGSPPLAFTFGLGALLIFPLYAGATAVLIENGSPKNLAMAIDQFKATISFTSPTGYNAMLNELGNVNLSSLEKSVSAGEHLQPVIFERWKNKTGLSLLNGIGSTEMIHIFISTDETNQSPGLTGNAIPGYQACIMDKEHNILPPGNEGYLAVKGPTGCKYLDDDRQSQYVINGWNVTGDVFTQDKQGQFWFKGRSDDLIVSSGYNISSIEVETVVQEHQAVMECAVIGIPDEERGKLVKAFVVLNEGYAASDTLIKSIQNFVKQETSPYKYPRKIEFIGSLPKTETGKIQRFKLS